MIPGIKFSTDSAIKPIGIGFKYPIGNALRVETVSSVSTKAILSENPSFPVNSFTWPASGAILIIWKPIVNLSTTGSRYLISGANSLSIDATWANTFSFAATAANSTCTVRFYDAAISAVYNRTITFPAPAFLANSDNRTLITWQPEGASQNRWKVFHNGQLLDSALANNTTMPITIRDLVIGGLTSTRAGLGGADVPIECKIALVELYSTVITDGQASVITNANYGPGIIQPRNRWKFESGSIIVDSIGGANLYTTSSALYESY